MVGSGMAKRFGFIMESKISVWAKHNKRAYGEDSIINHLVTLWVLMEENCLLLRTFQESFWYGTSWASLEAHATTQQSKWTYPCNWIYDKGIYCVYMSDEMFNFFNGTNGVMQWCPF